MLESAELPSKRFSRMIVSVPSHLKFKRDVVELQITFAIISELSVGMNDRMKKNITLVFHLVFQHLLCQRQCENS